MTTQYWTDIVYRSHARLLYDVEAALFCNPELTRQEIAMATTVANLLGKGLRSPILDLACGPGRHTVQLFHDGYRDITGVDFSEEFLSLATTEMNGCGTSTGKPRFVLGDMRSLQFPAGAFQTVLLLGNSFGYFSDEENLKVLQEVYRVLGENGLFCLEITNKEVYLATLKPYEEELIEGRIFGRLKSQWWKTWDHASGRVKTLEKHSSAISGEVLYQGPYEVRLYDRKELEELLRQVGFSDVAVMPFTPSKDSLKDGLGDTFGAMGEVVFVGAVKSSARAESQPQDPVHPLLKPATL